jgi:LysM repeat protein
MMLEVANAKVVECNIVTGGTKECNPYSSRFIKAKEVKYDLDRKKLIITKTLPVPEKKSSIKVVSVEDMIERYVKVEDSMRFKGNEPVPSEEIKKEIIVTSIEKIRLARKKLFDQMKKVKEEKEEKRLASLKLEEEEKIKELETEQEKRLASLKLAEEEKKKELEKEEEKRLERIKLTEEKRKNQGLYVIEKGDSLSTIAAKFNIKTKTLRTLNNLEKKSAIRIGKKLTIPHNQKRVDAIARAEYVVEKGDSIGSIAQDFNLTSKAIVEHNRLKRKAKIRLGQKIRLPLPYALKKKRSKSKLIRDFNKKKFSKSFGRKKLRVTATAYSSHRKQTDKTPFLAAWNNRLRPGMKAIAVSRDMLTKYGMKNGTKVRIAGLPGYYRVKDKMNKRYRKRIDIYMGVNRRKALRWGRRSVVIYW